MTNSKNPNRGHYSPSPTVTHGTKNPAATKAGDTSKTGTARQGGESR